MRRTSSTWRTSDERGLTLIEVTVAVAIMAIVLAVAIPAFESASGADLRSAAARLGAVSRAVSGEASVRNVTLRIAYDFEHGAYWVEAYPGLYQMIGTDKDLDTVREDDSRKAEDAKRKKELEDRFSQKREADDQAAAPAPKFVPVALDFLEPIERMPNGIRIIGVRTPQFRQRIKDGKAYTHFFAGGFAEHTLVYLADKWDHKVTLEMEPASGHLVVWDGEVEYRDIDDKRAKGEVGD